MRLNERTELLLVALARTSMAVCTRGASAWAVSWAAAAAMRAASTRRLVVVMVAEGGHVDTAETSGGLGSGILRHCPRRLLVTARQTCERCFYSSYSQFASSYGKFTLFSETGSYYGNYDRYICQKLIRHQILQMEFLSTNCLNMQSAYH